MNKSEIVFHLISDIREHLAYYKELGVELLDVKVAEAVSSERLPSPANVAEDSPEVVAIAREVPEMPVAAKSEPAKPNVKRPSRLTALPSLSNRTTSGGNGIEKSAPKENETHDAASAQQVGKTTNEVTAAKESLTDALFDVGPELPTSGETIEDIRKDIGDCTRCELYTGRKQVVHSTGNLQADLMFVGEAPGADEDAQGFPFVGRAGQLLTKIIEGIGYKREDVFIGNINRCRPPGNRQPTLPEAHTCRPFLLREIAVVRPKVIVVLGNTAMHNLLDTKVGITKMRGHFQDYFGVKVMPTFHPAFLLRDPHKKREVWEDMKKVRDYLKTAK
ncbi:MAG TPA: uracil-DNA glycosylase [Pyrinomonadaceae bacterium]|jgi:uracil-DNA glycosylase|nr:uracil-DNA glycosylase [Pyrinomonadaceae bacterium]